MATESLADDRIRIESTGEHPSASVQTADGRWVRYHSGRQPMAEAERFIESALGSIPGGAPAVVLLIGAGLGYAIEAIARRAPATRIIAIEPLPALAQAMRARRDWSDLIESRRLTVLVGPDYRGGSEVGPTLDEKTTASATIIEHPVLTREFPEETVRARAIADGILEGAKLNAEARKAFAGRYLLNTLRNLPALVDEADVDALRDAFIGVPAIVVGAGPSLDANIAQLKTLQDRALIIAVDTSLRPLRAAGIRPHLIVAVDPSDLNARHLLSLHETESSWLVGEGSLDPRVFPQFAGRVFSFKVSGHQPWPWLQASGFDRGRLRAWGSVLTTAFDLAIQAGCDPIVFAGSDLAFTGGVHYCRGTMNEVESYHDAPTALRAEGFALALREQQRQTSPATDIHGREVVSTPLFTQFRDWIAARAEESSPRRILNATGAGILHGTGITQTDLAKLPLAEISGGRDSIRARVARAWNNDREKRAETRQRLEHPLASGSDELPMAAWVEFACGGATAEQIAACVDEGWRRAPVITAHPQSLSRLAGWNATYVAAAAGGPRPTVQWQQSRDGGQSWANVPGATLPTFTARADGAAGTPLTFRAVFSNAHGSVATDGATLGIARPRASLDFNGDGCADIFWRHYGTGLLAVWFMQGPVESSSGQLDKTETDHAWRVAAIADFNGDGMPDLLWRHDVLGANRIWLMDGVTVTGVEPIQSEDDVSWQIVGVGDFNGDGKPDLLWRHAGTGDNALWLMDGLTRTAVVPLDAEADMNWSIVGVGDANRDGKPDIFWRNTLTGANAVWLMDGVTRTGHGQFAAEPDLGWRIVTVADFGGGHGTDLLWRHAQTGAGRIWTLNRLVRTGEHNLRPVDDPSWVMAPETNTR